MSSPPKTKPPKTKPFKISNLPKISEINKCRKCGKRHEYECPKKCERCGRNSHEIGDCYAKKDLDGNVLHDI